MAHARVLKRSNWEDQVIWSRLYVRGQFAFIIIRSGRLDLSETAMWSGRAIDAFWLTSLLLTRGVE
jgi:hypothetical protein